MALTQQQLDATRKYKAGEITSDQYKQAYVTNYDPTKDKSFGKNIAYSGTSSPEALRIQEMSQAYQDSIAPKPAVQPVVQPVQMMPQQQLANAQKSQAVIELERARAKALGGLGAEQSAIAPKFEQGRSDTRRLAINQAKDFENFLATKGLSASGTAGQGMIQQQGQLLGSIGQSKTAESNANADIERRRSELETDFAFGVQSAEARAREQELERLYQQQNVADTRAYNEGLTAQEYAREDAQTAEERARQDFGATIMANYNDISAFANRLEASGAPQWQIDQARAAAVQKRADLNLDSQGKPIPTAPSVAKLTPSVAMELWQSLGTSTPAIAQALGVAEGQRYPTQASGSSGGSTRSTSTSGVAPTSTPKQIISYAESQLRGSGGSSAADKLVTLNNAGVMDNLTPSEIKSLMNKFGVDEKMIEQAENRLESLTKGVTLPSGRVTAPTNPNLLTR